MNKRSKSTNIVCLKDQDKELVGKKEIAESVNQFFCSVGKDLASEIDDAPNPLLSGDYTINFQEKRFECRAIRGQELRDTVGNCTAFAVYNCNLNACPSVFDKFYLQWLPSIHIQLSNLLPFYLLCLLLIIVLFFVNQT